jgi:hypothetical protein
MRFTRTKHRLFVFCAGCWAFAGIALADSLPPIWFQPPMGTALPSTSWTNVTNGVGFYSLPNFDFNFLGVNYTSATLSSNGSIYLGPQPATPQPQGSPNVFLQGQPRIAPAWYDIQDIDGAGSVYVNTLANQLVITFMGVASCTSPVCAPPASDLATFQVILNNDGSIIFAYEVFNSIGTNNPLLGSTEAIVGVTSGVGGGTAPAALDLSSDARNPGYVYTSAGPTVYQDVIYNSPTDPSQFAGLDLIFTPQAGLTWQVTSDYAGEPAPEPATLSGITLSALALYLWRGRSGRPSSGRL